MEDEVPNFDLGDSIELLELNEMTDGELLKAIFNMPASAVTAVDFNDANASSNVNTNLEMKRALDIQQPQITEPGERTKRFKVATDQDILNYQSSRQSKSTKKNTRWGYKTFQDWSVEVIGQATNFENISAPELDSLLCRFYAEAVPKPPEKRDESERTSEYHKNAMKNIRSALNRHLKDIGKDFDIVRDKEFRKSNNTLDGKLKFNLKNGMSRATQHKEIISPPDLISISTYLYSELNPIILRYRVWYDISMNFVTRGLEFHQQLNPRSFVFKTDENGIEYVQLSHETMEKNWQGGLNGSENPADKRMYACVDSNRCPVASLKIFLSKTDPNSQHLFNHCKKQALESPENESIWYTCEPVKYHQFTQFMSDISRKSGCSTRYTAHCIRATAIQALNDMGFELRHIMYFSGHRSESAVRSYNRDCTSHQKKSISNTLSCISTGNVPSSSSSICLPPLPAPVTTASTSLPAATNSICPASCTNEYINLPVSLNNTNTLSSRLISNSAFNNCVFNFNSHV